MNKSTFLIFVAIGLLAVGALLYFTSHDRVENKLIPLNEECSALEGEIQSLYQGRYNKAKELVPIVEKSLSHEKEKIAALTSAMNSVSSIKPGLSAEYMGAQNALSAALRPILTVQLPENADKLLVRLFDEMSTQENMIHQAMRKLQQAVKDFNIERQRPENRRLIDSGDYPKRDYFKASAEAQDAPDIKIN